MSSDSYRRRTRAPKPLRVPVLGALAGLLVFILGMALSSSTLAGFGLLIGVWGIISFSFLLISRRMRAGRAINSRS